MSEFTIDYILNRAGDRYSGTNGSLGIALHQINNNNYNNHNNYDINNCQQRLDANNEYNNDIGLSSEEKEEREERENENVQSDSRFTFEEFPMLDWLRYTRYHPPKLPRSLRQGFFKRTRTPGRLPRIPFTPAQLHVLESAYKACNYLSAEEANNLAISLNLTNTRVKIWFQNRRARERREKRNNKDDNCDSTLSSNVSSPELAMEDVVEIL